MGDVFSQIIVSWLDRVFLIFLKKKNFNILSLNVFC